MFSVCWVNLRVFSDVLSFIFSLTFFSFLCITANLQMFCRFQSNKLKKRSFIFFPFIQTFFFIFFIKVRAVQPDTSPNAAKPRLRDSGVVSSTAAALTPAEMAPVETTPAMTATLLSGSFTLGSVSWSLSPAWLRLGSIGSNCLLTEAAFSWWLFRRPESPGGSSLLFLRFGFVSIFRTLTALAEIRLWHHVPHVNLNGSPCTSDQLLLTLESLHLVEDKFSFRAWRMIRPCK